ncbi:hypothetical protein [Klebsiella phage vB_KvaS_F1M1D]|nr:hypothetical protein [Klebsiella phage vB_KvaS_F1M1D]
MGDDSKSYQTRRNPLTAGEVMDSSCASHNF